MAAVDWEKWRLIHSAPLWQWVALLSGLNPDEITFIAPEYGFAGNGVGAGDFGRNLEIALSHAGKTLSVLNEDGGYAPERSEVKSQDFWAWAVSTRLRVPPEIEVTSPAETTGPVVIGWDAICERLTRRAGHDVSPRSAQRWLAAAGIKHTRRNGRVCVSEHELERMALPAST